MAGYKTLNESGYEALHEAEWRDQISKIELEDIHQANPVSSRKRPIQYLYQEKENLIFVISPIEAHEFALLCGLIRNHLPQYQNPQMLMGVYGNGLSEKHIISAHIDSSSKVRFYDSKTSDMEKFFEPPEKGGFSLIGLYRALRGLYRALFTRQNTINIPNQKIEAPSSDSIVLKKEDFNDNEQSHLLSQATAEYYSLGTQSLFDPVSCGYHSAATLKICADLIREERAITDKEILKKTINPVRKETVRKETVQKEAGFRAFLRKAWLDTLVPLDNLEKTGEKASFLHHFLGWPKENTGKKLIYFLTLGFITKPLLNVLRLPVELPFNVLSETANYIKNRLIATAPTSTAGQYLRSAMLLLSYGFQGLFKGGYLLLRTVTSPVTSFQAAQQLNNPVLSKLLSLSSLLLSAAAYSALAFFVAPLVLNALAPLAGPALAQAVAAIAYPFSQLFALMGVSLAPATAAAATLISASALLVGMKGLANKIASVISGKKPVQSDINNLEDFEEIGEPTEENKASKESSSLTIAKGLNPSSPEASLTSPPEPKDALEVGQFSSPLNSPSTTDKNNASQKSRSRHYGLY